MSGIFISYRRDDSAAIARRLYELLRARFGLTSVFIDVETIEAGADFAEVIDAKVGFCDGFVAVIGKAWSTAVDTEGRRRLDDPEDWVRLE
ncbi:MAG: toll/interleukin-1 receptor domain-containing protein, partial [Candidatus Rokuibacteriota bacterium]